MKFILPFVFGISIFFSDFLTKQWAQKLKQPLSIIGDFFRFDFQQNPGIAFSIPISNLLQIILSFFFFFLLLSFWKKSLGKKGENFAFAALFAGALGNFRERIFGGSVTDFLAVWHFPIFNIADVAIFCGVVWILIAELYANSQSNKE